MLYPKQMLAQGKVFSGGIFLNDTHSSGLKNN